MAAKLTDSDENLKPAEPGWLMPAKIAVVVMGILILVGLGVIAYTVATRLAGADKEEAPTAAVSVPQSSSPVLPAPSATVPSGTAAPGAIGVPNTLTIPRPGGFGTVTIPMPKGGRLGPAEVDGGRLVLQVRLPGGHLQVMIVDLATGKLLGTLNFTQH